MWKVREIGFLDWWKGHAAPVPTRLRQRLSDARDLRHHREIRFLSIVVMIITLGSLLVDLLTIPGVFGRAAFVRVGICLTLATIAFVTPLAQLRWQKLFFGLAAAGLAGSFIYSGSLAQEPDNILLSLASIILIGLAGPVLPFRRRETLAFLIGTAVLIGLLAIFFETHSFTDAFLATLVLVSIGSGVLARRVQWLERQLLLQALLAEERANLLETSNEKLTRLSMQDPLTNLANRRWTEMAFAKDYAKSSTEAPGYTALVLLDLDHFKDFNDRYGHDAGDKCLQATAEVLRHAAEAHSGLAARFGGEEFVVLIRAIDSGEVQELAEALRVGIERIEIKLDSSSESVTCTTSIGAAIHRGSDAPVLSSLLKRADTALYRAKEEGRNRVRMAS